MAKIYFSLMLYVYCRLAADSVCHLHSGTQADEENYGTWSLLRQREEHTGS